ncbi:hypothetical protein CANARDRAFT_20989 [[Candida] arabinofermentans NRRL YB-2248]|uniref:Uncharacterized protein n=1 Tax=[Candida] arabinofermentans NRRL YB-2248 TaxID=983967 RepID=A0A1E4T958_9ASCO|nr:hypothetical protein CANARDRAFT_20989 [[Candida] arabinofermentans NRRL YB-2248]
MLMALISESVALQSGYFNTSSSLIPSTTTSSSIPTPSIEASGNGSPFWEIFVPGELGLFSLDASASDYFHFDDTLFYFMIDYESSEEYGDYYSVELGYDSVAFDLTSSLPEATATAQVGFGGDPLTGNGQYTATFYLAAGSNGKVKRDETTYTLVATATVTDAASSSSTSSPSSSLSSSSSGTSSASSASATPSMFGYISGTGTYWWQVDVPESLGTDVTVYFANTDQYSLNINEHFPDATWTTGTDEFEFSGTLSVKNGVGSVDISFDPSSVDTSEYYGYATVVTDNATYHLVSNPLYVPIDIRLLAFQNETTGNGVFEVILPSNYTPFGISAENGTDWSYDKSYFSVYNEDNLLKSSITSMIEPASVTMSYGAAPTSGGAYSVQFGMTPDEVIWVTQAYTGTFTVTYVSASVTTSEVLSTTVTVSPTAHPTLFGFQIDKFAVWEIDIPTDLSPFLVEGTPGNFKFNESHWYLEDDYNQISATDLELDSTTMVYSYSTGTYTDNIQIGAGISQNYTGTEEQTYSVDFTVYPWYSDTIKPTATDIPAFSFAAVLTYTPSPILAVMTGATPTGSSASNSSGVSVTTTDSSGVTTPVVYVYVPVHAEPLIGMELSAVTGNIAFDPDLAYVDINEEDGSVYSLDGYYNVSGTEVDASQDLKVDVSCEEDWFSSTELESYVYQLTGWADTATNYSATMEITYTYLYDTIASTYEPTFEGQTLTASTSIGVEKRANGLQLSATSVDTLSTVFGHHSTVGAAGTAGTAGESTGAAGTGAAGTGADATGTGAAGTAGTATGAAATGSSTSGDSPSYVLSIDGSTVSVIVTVPQSIREISTVSNEASGADNFEFSSSSGLDSAFVSSDGISGSLSSGDSPATYIIVGNPIDPSKIGSFELTISVDSDGSKKLAKRDESWTVTVDIPVLSGSSTSAAIESATGTHSFTESSSSYSYGTSSKLSVSLLEGAANKLATGVCGLAIFMVSFLL